jgi:hypothetical protein
MLAMPGAIAKFERDLMLPLPVQVDQSRPISADGYGREFVGDRGAPARPLSFVASRIRHVMPSSCHAAVT